MKTCCHTLGLTVQLLESRLKVCQADNARCQAENKHLRKLATLADRDSWDAEITRLTGELARVREVKNLAFEKIEILRDMLNERDAKIELLETQ